MKRAVRISEYFPKHLFWDMDSSKLKVERDKDIIIPRALFATTEATFQDDITKLENLYSKDEIVEELKDTKERISNDVCLLVAQRYKVKEFYRFRK